MWSTLITGLIGIGGTSIGAGIGVLGIWLKGRHDREARRENRLYATIDAAIKEFAALVKALTAHRVAMWNLEAARYRGEADEVVQPLLEATLVTRDALSDLEVTVTLMIPALAPEITRAVQATYEMDSVMDPARAAVDPVHRKDLAKAALATLRTRATELFGQAEAGLPAPDRKQLAA